MQQAKPKSRNPESYLPARNYAALTVGSALIGGASVYGVCALNDIEHSTTIWLTVLHLLTLGTLVACGFELRYLSQIQADVARSWSSAVWRQPGAVADADASWPWAYWNEFRSGMANPGDVQWCKKCRQATEILGSVTMAPFVPIFGLCVTAVCWGLYGSFQFFSQHGLVSDQFLMLAWGESTLVFLLALGCRYRGTLVARRWQQLPLLLTPLAGDAPPLTEAERPTKDVITVKESTSGHSNGKAAEPVIELPPNLAAPDFDDVFAERQVQQATVEVPVDVPVDVNWDDFDKLSSGK